MPAFRQLDDHSCGFVAVLAVVKHFAPRASAKGVLEAVRPSEEFGCGQPRVVEALRAFGVRARYRADLDLARLHGLLGEGTPVVVTVWPKGWVCDHWTVVRGTDLAARRVYLVNHADGTTRRGGMSWRAFRSVWSPCGGGLVCEG
jgi:hypothetical protein